MGTIFDWVSVLALGGFWGVGMLFFELASKTRYRVIDGVTLVLGSLLFGMLMTFGWHRAVQWPLLALTIPVVAAFVILGVANRHFAKSK